jgi:hypothetical protein
MDAEALDDRHNDHTDFGRRDTVGRSQRTSATSLRVGREGHSQLALWGLEDRKP